MSAQSLTEEVKEPSAWSIFMGIVTAAVGCFLIVYPLATAAITTVLLGWALIFVGLAQFVFALYSQTIGNFFLTYRENKNSFLKGTKEAGTPPPNTLILPD
jgi:uncharacterized membrane protein HdeD (DUF308 family)